MYAVEGCWPARLQPKLFVFLCLISRISLPLGGSSLLLLKYQCALPLGINPTSNLLFPIFLN